MKNETNKGIIVSGGTLNANNIVTGDNAILNISNGAENVDFDNLTKELARLRKKLSEVADDSAESSKDIGLIANAEIASKGKDSNKVVQYLKDVGKWVLDTAKEIGVDVVTELLKKNLS